jgi:hypothetical protein
MKTVLCIALASALAVATTLAPGHAFAQAEPEKRPGPVPQASPAPVPSTVAQPGPTGAPEDDATRVNLKAALDSTMTRMDELMKQSTMLSSSFAELATLHHGADKSEILMMQRVSDALGAMADEVKQTVAQYKRMLDDESALETGAMKSEVDGLHAVMEVIAGEVDDALQTLQRLQAQLGQG